MKYLLDITRDIIYSWLEQMNVANTTKLTRLKCFKAFLGRCFDNGWFANKFWRSVNIKVDMEIKVGATDEEVNLLLSVLDYTKFIDLRNATAILLMYRCGLRIGTIARMREQHVDFVNQRLRLDGEVMKNHKGLILPIDNQIAYLLEVMVKQNSLIRSEFKEVNDNLFITVKGKPTSNSITSNSIQKQLRKYTLKYGINNINPHTLRRGFAKNIYAKSNDLLLVSKALSFGDGI
ncbi:site-specific integrase [Metabacillus sp. FJAT-53654]|uniref:Site-specific integrase n=1 Tax=Metabacillus rhizosphaerae TaxID=3117747 RepID=A0ABZ2MP55_9BACI